MDQTTYELGRYQKKVAEMMKIEKQLRGQNALKDMLLQNAILYIIHFAGLNASLPANYEISYADLKKLTEKYEVAFEPVEDKGMKICITEKEKTNTETTK